MSSITTKRCRVTIMNKPQILGENKLQNKCPAFPLFFLFSVQKLGQFLIFLYYFERNVQIFSSPLMKKPISFATRKLQFARLRLPRAVTAKRNISRRNSPQQEVVLNKKKIPWGKYKKFTAETKHPGEG